MNSLSLAVKFFFLKAIRFYQKTFSPDTGWFSPLHPFGYCKFQPHCSEYAYQAISKYGPVKGSFLALRRVLRCHPWSRGGPDPLK